MYHHAEIPFKHEDNAIESLTQNGREEPMINPNPRFNAVKKENTSRTVPEAILFVVNSLIARVKLTPGRNQTIDARAIDIKHVPSKRLAAFLAINDATIE